MDCKTCANYEPKKVERPTEPLGRIFAEDLRVGMVIRRHAVTMKRKLIVILGEIEEHTVPSLQFLAGHEPLECDMWLAAAGLKPYKRSGNWQEGTWCEEVT